MINFVSTLRCPGCGLSPPIISLTTVGDVGTWCSNCATLYPKSYPARSFPALIAEQHEVIPARWFATQNGTIGIAIVVDKERGEWRAYVGVAPSEGDEFEMAADIVRTGAKLSRREAEPYQHWVKGLEYAG